MNDLYINNKILIPSNELKITASRSSGAGGQHINKTETKITVRWNIKTSIALNEVQKSRILLNLKSKLTNNGELIIHNSESRSRQRNKENALRILSKTVNKALYISKKRIKTKIPKKSKEKRLQDKKIRSQIKKMRNIKIG